ncbi:hypothetical protein ACHAWT_004860 [Skeletonema menzelii]
MSLWSSLKKDYSEHTPLSTIDDDEEEPPLPPYSDNPDTPTIRTPYSDTPQDHNNGNGAAVRRTNGRSSSNGGGAPASAHKAMAINNDNDYYDDDEGFGEGDFYRSSGSSHRYSSTPSKHKRNNNATSTRYYRTGLICAYLQHWLTCCGNLGGGRTKRIFMCVFYMVLFVTIMVCASAIGYIIARDGSPFQSEKEVAKTAADAGSNSDGSNNNNINAGSVFGASTPDNGGGKTFDKQMNAAKLPPPPMNLHEICSDWITESGRQKCQTECSLAECCSFPATNKNSCWEEQAEECATYRAACMALELHSDDDTQSGSSSGVIGSKTILYAPPSNLPVLCSSTALSTPGGFDNCANVCRPSRCCFPDMFDCNLADDRYCEDYEDLCASVAESWRGSGHAVATTSSSTSSTSGGTTSSQNPTIANEVMKACNAANLNPPNACLEACKPGACCYVSSSYLPIEQLFDEYYGAANSPMRTVKSCASSVGFCQQYGSCEHLNHMKDVAGWNSDEVNYVVDVSTPCKAEHIAQFGALQCSNVCQPAHCCFSGEYACDDVQLGHLKCEDYKACQVLYPNKNSSTKELLELAERIDKVCSVSSLTTVGGRAECQDVCSDHLCCFYQDGCTNDPDKNCLAYAGCESYYNMPADGGQVDTSGSNNNAGSSTGSDMGIDEFEVALEETCSEENLKTINGIYKCHNKCQSHLCCFASGDQAQTDCSNQRPVACNAYEPCKRLVNPIHGDESVKTLEPADIETIVFDACYFGADPLKITEEMVKKCHGVCAQRLCCFSDYLLQSSCRATVGDDECNLYSLCEQLVTDNGVEVSNAIDLKENEYDVAHLCTSKVNEDLDLYQSCKGLCLEKRACCFDGPGYSCYEMEKEWCDEYKECERTNLKFLARTASNSNGEVSGGNNESLSTPEIIEKEVYDACYFDTDESRVTQDLVTKCNSVCKSSYRLESSCRASVGEDECELFALCEQMITADGGVVKTFIELDLQEFNDDDTSNSNSASGPGSIVQYPSGNTGVDGGNGVDTFASRLETVCSESSLKTLDGMQACHSKCQAHLCCFTTDSKRAGQNCSGLIPSGCLAYEPCKRLVVPPAGTEPAVSPTSLLPREEIEKRVYDACYFGDDPTRVTEDLVTKCHGVCAQRLCCFSDYKLQSSCRATVGDDECELYSLCDQLVTENGGATDDALELEEKEFDVDELCIDKVAVDKNLYSACSDTCERRSCCFESDPTYSCYDLEKDWCDDDTAGLIGSSNGEHDLYDAVDSACSVDSLKTLEGVEECFNKCQPYLCCFPEIASEIEWDCEGFRDEECSAYGNCEPLVASHQLWKPPSKAANKYAVKIAVNDVCILSNGVQPTEEWVSNCHQKCESRMCCLADPSIRSSCLATLGAEECNDYSACKVLIGGDSREAEGIEDVCSNVDDANSFAKCKAKCKTRQCCFENVHKFSCYHLEKEWCDEYEICGVVGLTLSSSSNAPPTPGAQISAPSPSQPSSQTTISAPTASITPPPAPRQPVVNTSSQISQGDSDSELLILARACNADQLENDATECRMLCKGSECCFTTHVENNCSRKPGMTAFCLDHMLCADLY